MGKIFRSTSKHLAPNEKHFKDIDLTVAYSNETQATLEDDSFADLTFDDVRAQGIRKLSNKAFGKAAKTIKYFLCFDSCAIKNSPPNYDVWKSLSTLTNLKSLRVILNVTEIPLNAFEGEKLNEISLTSKQNLTIKSGAFENVKKAIEIEIYGTSIKKIENQAFKTNYKFDNKLFIYFTNSKMNGDSFEKGAFDGAQGPLFITFHSTNINFLPESSFKSVLSSKQNTVDLFNPTVGGNSKIDCNDCRNHWLIKDNTDNQVHNAYCMGDPKKMLFDQDIKDRLNVKCK